MAILWAFDCLLNWETVELSIVLTNKCVWIVKPKEFRAKRRENPFVFPILFQNLQIRILIIEKASRGF